MSADSDDALSSDSEGMTTLLDMVSPTTEKMNEGVAVLAQNEERLYYEVSDEIERKLQELQLAAERERGARPKVPSASTLGKNDEKISLMEVDGKMNENNWSELSRAGEGEDSELLERELDRSQRDLERAVTAKQRLQELYRDRAKELVAGEQRLGERELMKEYFSGVEEMGRLENAERSLRRELKAVCNSEAKLQWELDSLGCLSRPNQWAVGAPYGRSRAARSGR